MEYILEDSKLDNLVKPRPHSPRIQYKIDRKMMVYDSFLRGMIQKGLLRIRAAFPLQKGYRFILPTYI